MAKLDRVYLLISSAQSFTGSWANLGSVLHTNGMSYIGLFLKVTANNSLNMRVRVLGKLSLTDSDSYVFPIRDVQSNSIKVQGEYFELTNDTDQNIVIGVDLKYIIPAIQFQISAGTAGATAGQIAKASYIQGEM